MGREILPASLPLRIFTQPKICVMKKHLLLPAIVVTVLCFMLAFKNAPAHFPGMSKIRPDTAADSMMEMKVGDLKQYSGDQYVVELEPKKGKTGYLLPVVIGTCEITALYNQINEKTTPRPMTYDLVTNIFKAADMKIKKVAITELKDGTYYAVISILSGGKTLDIDSRPSDALNLALRAKAPIYLAGKVWNEAKEVKSSEH